MDRRGAKNRFRPPPARAGDGHGRDRRWTGWLHAQRSNPRSGRRRTTLPDLRFQPTRGGARVRTKLARLRYALLTGATAVLIVLLFWNWLEADMTRHMLCEFPLLLIAGAAVGRCLPEPFDARVAACNQLGLTGF